MLLQFHDFIEKKCKESELFRYWNNVLILISLMHDLIRANRTGNWRLHMKTIKKLQPIFHIMDRVNYSRWCALYLEDMETLEETAEEVYLQFMNGRFTLKRSQVPFTSVATDQALEQTINRSSKSTAGVIGITKKKQSVAAWDLTFHEFLAVTNYVKEITRFSNEDQEFKIHHEFSVANTEVTESAVNKILKYLEDKKINPFISGSYKLRNIITEELVDEKTAKEILNIFSAGIEIYKTFRKKRFLDRSKPLSALISRVNLPNFKTTSVSKEPTSKKKVKSKLCETQRILALAQERHYPIEKLLKYHLTYSNPLFD